MGSFIYLYLAHVIYGASLSGSMRKYLQYYIDAQYHFCFAYIAGRARDFSLVLINLLIHI